MLDREFEAQVNRESVYWALFTMTRQKALKEGLTEDKANRKANIYAVKNTNKVYSIFNANRAKHWTAFDID